MVREKYRIVRLLGRGGMGTVYLAEHLLLRRPRALKFISGELSHDTKLLRRFFQEAQASVELRHPNIVEVVDLDQAEDGSPYMAMEYIEGPSLRHELAAGVFPVERAIAIARGVALGLEVAHGKGIIHRDVKPENILLAQRGDTEIPKLLDFGIAAILDSSSGLSRTRGLMLTPEYAAPEQWKGVPAEQMDGRVDLYALGGVLYEMLTGQTCFQAQNTQAWLYQHLQEAPRAAGGLRPEVEEWEGLETLVLRLLAKEPEQRPANAAETVRALDAVHRVKRRTTTVTLPAAKGAATVLEPAGGHGGAQARRRSAAMALLAGAALLAVSAGGFFAYQTLHGRASRPGSEMAVSSQPTGGAMAEGGSPTATSRQRNPPASGKTGGQAVPQPASPPEPRAEPQGKTQPGSTQPRSTQPGSQESHGTVPGSTPAQNPANSAGTAEAKRQGKELYDQKRFSEAVPLLDRACDGGDQESCSKVGFMYVMGTGVGEDDRHGEELLTGACDKGYAPGCTNMGTLMRLHVSTWRQAVQYFTRGCDGNDPYGCNNLALLYREGLAVDKDMNRAKQFFDKSCSLGNQAGCNEAKKIEAALVPPKPLVIETWTDPATGITWTKQDNGHPTTFAGAANYCQNLRAGNMEWRLPTLRELRTIYDSQASVPCVGLKCRINPVFAPTATSIWTSDPAKPGNATLFGFNGGEVYDIIDSFDNARAMCVKR